MASTLASALSDLRTKIELLARRQEEMRAEIESLKALNDDLRAELEQTRTELKNAQTDAEFLTMSHRLADSPDSIIATRRHIARLIRTIDLCILMLKE